MTVGFPRHSNNVVIVISGTCLMFPCRSITAKNFLTAIRRHLAENSKESPMLSGMVTCRRDDNLKSVITKLDSLKIHRIYVVDNAGNLEGIITLRDIISKLVHEPRGYFGDFFDGVLPLPPNTRVWFSKFSVLPLMHSRILINFSPGVCMIPFPPYLCVF